MSKKKPELTLEELQARKSKRQRGWVRVCAIILAVVLTGGVYGLAAKGGPRKQKFSPSVVQVNGGTVVQKEETPAPAPAPAPSEPSAPAPTPDEEGGGLLDMIMGLIGGIDFGSLIEKLNPGQLGITIADKIDIFKDNLLDKINEFQNSIHRNPVITHDAVVEDFPAVDMTEDQQELNSDENKQKVVDTLKNYTEGVLQGKKHYTVTRDVAFAPNGNVNIGSKTDQINSILSTASQGKLSLDTIVSQIVGIHNSSLTVADGQTFQEALQAQFADQKDPQIPFLLANELRVMDLAPEEIWVESFDEYYKTYRIHLQNVANPNRETVCGFTKVTQDFAVQNEVANKIQGNKVSPLKLSDLNVKYQDVVLELCVDPGYESIKVSFVGDAQFVVRTNTVQITGKTATTTTVNYAFA